MVCKEICEGSSWFKSANILVSVSLLGSSLHVRDQISWSTLVPRLLYLRNKWVVIVEYTERKADNLQPHEQDFTFMQQIHMLILPVFPSLIHIKSKIR